LTSISGSLYPYIFLNQNTRLFDGNLYVALNFWPLESRTSIDVLSQDEVFLSPHATDASGTSKPQHLNVHTGNEMVARLEESIRSLSEQVLVVASNSAHLFELLEELKASYTAQVVKLQEDLKASNVDELARLQEELKASHIAELFKLQEWLKFSNKNAELEKFQEKVSGALEKLENQVRRLEESFRQNGAISGDQEVTAQMDNNPKQGGGCSTQQRQFRRNQQLGMLPSAGTGLQLTEAGLPVGKPRPQQETIVIKGHEPLTASMMAAVTPFEQKQMLGERLYTLVHQRHPEFAGKITGMFLENDNAELLHMLRYPESLKPKVEEAIALLEALKAKKHKLLREAPSTHCPQKRN
jgi:hypothetical protein